MVPLERPIPLYNINGLLNKAGSITHVVRLWLKIAKHEEVVSFTVMDLGPKDVILGIDWLRQHNPEVNWTKGEVEFLQCLRL